jgi:hypothetical protein
VPKDSQHTSGDLLVRIEGHELPGRTCGPGPDYPDGHHNVHVGVQRRGKPSELLDLTGGDASEAVWSLECTQIQEARHTVDVKGPYVQGPVGGRFIYLSWGVVDDGAFTMFRRAKLWLDAVPPEVLDRAASTGVLVGRLGLTDEGGQPRCASVRPPLIQWSAAKR